MAQQVEKWTIEKVLVCLKRIVHQDVLPSISQEELDKFGYRKVFKGKEKVLDFLKFVYKKSNGKLEIYGSVDEMIDCIRKIDQIPEFIKFSFCSEVEVSSICACLTMNTSNHRTIGSVVYLSISDIAINSYKLVASLVRSFGMNSLTIEIFLAWQITHLNNILNGFKGSYYFPPLDSRQRFLDEISSFLNTRPNIKVPEEPVTIESFSKLKAYFDPKYEKIFNYVLNILKGGMMKASKQEYYKETYAQIIFLLENIKRIYDRYSELFIPSTALEKTPSINYKPVVRCFDSHAIQFCLSGEIKNAMQRIMIKNESDEKWKDVILVESEEERKNGIIYATHPSKFIKLLKELNCTHDKFAPIAIHLEEDYQGMSLPIISSYGTHCMPVLEAFCRIVYYLTVILKVFLRCSVENIRKVFKWIDDVIDSLAVEKPVFYLIEIWRLDKIIDRARKDLTPLLTEPDYEVPYQPQYSKNEVFREYVKMLRNLGWEQQHFLKTANLLLSLLSRSTITIKNVYTVYGQMVRLYLQEFRPKVISFIKSQSIFNKRYAKTDDLSGSSQPESKSETLTGSKKRFSNECADSSKKEERNKTEKIQHPSCSTENVEDRVEEKLLEGQFVKQLNTFVQKIQQHQGEMEKSQKIELNYQNEIQNLKEIKEKTDKKVEMLETDLEREKIKTVDLENKSKMLEKECEELKQKVEFLMSKIESPIKKMYVNR